MKDCIFCKIISGELPCSKVYEDNDIFAFMDIQPINQGHVLVVPKIHKELMVDLDDDLIKKLIIVGNKINKAIRKSDIKAEGVNFFLADGEAAGQEVFHVHLHLVPRFKKDGFDFIYPKGYTDKPESEELEKIAKKIKNKF
jgi:histidine triad (HIT) family protein